MSTTPPGDAGPENLAEVPMNVGFSDLVAIPTLQPHSSLGGTCVNCRRRKVRCDKLSPCSNCIRTRTQCDFAPRKRAPRKPKNKQNEGENSGERETELLKRLNKLEGTIRDPWRLVYPNG
jgi:hypothetical protein